MSYCTKQKLIDRGHELELKQLTDTTGAGVINDTVLNQAIADADAEINVYLTGRYALPLQSVPEVLVRVACDISRYYLFGKKVTEQVEKRYQNALDLLRSISKGTVQLGLDSGNQVIEPDKSSDEAVMQSSGSAFSRGAY